MNAKVLAAAALVFASASWAGELPLVVDSTGAVVGRIVDLGAEQPEQDNLNPFPGGGGAAVAFRVGSRVVVLHVGTQGFITQGDLAFLTPDCTGTPYIIVPSPGGRRKSMLFGPAVVAPPGKTLYIIDYSTPLATREIHSIIAFERGTPQGCLDDIRWPLLVGLAEAHADLATKFQPPFHVDWPEDLVNLDAR